MPTPFQTSFSVELWIVPCSPKISARGFRYACFNRDERRRNINHLAPPEIRALLPAEPAEPQLLGYDPETGEIIEEPAEAAEAAE